MTAAEFEGLRAQAARVSAWGLWVLSLVAAGAAWAAIADRDWTATAGLCLVMVLLAWAAGSERQEQRACEAHQLDLWLQAWS